MHDFAALNRFLQEKTSRGELAPSSATASGGGGEGFSSALYAFAVISFLLYNWGMRRDLIGETLLKQFRVDTFIASGGMATIYRVWDLQRSVPLAMKVLNPELAEDPAFMARFEREAHSLQLLVHPHIVPFYGLFREDGITFLLERYIDGPTLDEVLRARGGQPLRLVEALVYFKALYTSAGYAHAQGIIHCDIKPGNVLIDKGGHVYLTDFGISRFMDSATTTASSMGTPLYMAPEQIRGERVTPQTDIYALGVLMFELLTGQRPFSGSVGVPEGVGENQSDRIRYQQVYVAPPDPHALNPALPEALSAAILKAMSKDPAARFGSVQEMAEAISRAVAARFDTLPDRVSLPQQPAWPQEETYPTYPNEAQGYPADAPPVDDTLPGARPAARPAPTWASAPGQAVPDGFQTVYPGAAAPARGLLQRIPRWLPLLIGLLLLLALCGVIAAQVFRGLRPAAIPPAAPNPAATVTHTPGATTSPLLTPTGAPGLTPAPGLSDFAVSGQIAVVQRSGGTEHLYLLDAASGKLSALPTVPNVTETQVNAPQWSPDGQRLTWISSYKGRMHVVAMNMTEAEPYQLPAGEAYSRLSAPAFLPDGKRISFYASGGGGSLLVLADAVTGEASETVSLPEYRSMFVWNAHSGGAAFVFPGGGSYKVAVAESPGGSRSAIDTGGEGYAPAWSNDGQWIAFQSDLGRGAGLDEIWLARADGSDLHAVTSTPEQFWSRAPTFSPDGRRIAFVSNRSGGTGSDYGELFVVDLETGQTRQLTSTGGQVYDWRPAWRP